MYYVVRPGTQERTGRKYIELVIDATDCRWSWVDHPHVPFHDYPDNHGSYTFYDIDIGDFTSLVRGNPGLRAAPAAAVEALDTNVQEMIDNARRAYGLAAYKPAAKWSACVAVSGGDWVYETLLDAAGAYHQEFFIARIDIEACKNIIKPDSSVAFRSQDRRRFSYDFDDKGTKDKVTTN